MSHCKCKTSISDENEKNMENIKNIKIRKMVTFKESKQKVKDDIFKNYINMLC